MQASQDQFYKFFHKTDSLQMIVWSLQVSFFQKVIYAKDTSSEMKGCKTENRLSHSFPINPFSTPLENIKP